MSVKPFTLSAILLGFVMIQVQAGFFSRGYVNYLLNRQGENGIIPLSRVQPVEKPLSSMFPGPLMKRPLLRASRWMIVEDDEGHIKFVERVKY
ncbi:hypothetical protein QR680_015917 [Steinernema hermaphroditum]|uniref:Uncharacterized protein n=1 Tax=Steinernema hermaphroditum TaxID=289476 RepID=A0AA39LLQ2_9BILA|nr:hypothetical protein QR680_015917 [Steinernema hermaphroditum]